MASYVKVYSDYEIKESAIKFNGENEIATTKVGCVGSLTEEMDVRTVTKKCEGVVIKSRTRGTGTGTLTVSMHMLWSLYVKVYGMIFTDKLAEGVYGYGKDSIHPEFTWVAKVLDEDGIEKYLAYPNGVINSGTSKKIENGSDEVAEIEMTIAVSPDDQGFGKYECMASELASGSEIATKWLTSFNFELIKKA